MKMELLVFHEKDGIEKYDVEKFNLYKSELEIIIRKAIKSGFNPQKGNSIISEDGEIYAITGIWFGNIAQYYVSDLI